jgi:hypothetical protein
MPLAFAPPADVVIAALPLPPLLPLLPLPALPLPDALFVDDPALVPPLVPVPLLADETLW